MSEAEYKQRGLLKRYHYERLDGQALDPTEEVFTLRIDKDDPWGAACRATLLDHARRIEALGYGQLAADLRQRIELIEARLKLSREGANLSPSQNPGALNEPTP